MSVRLTWPPVNAALADSIKIYRSTTPIPENNLPAAFATLAGNAELWDDTAIARNTVMYYRVGQTRGSEELVSPQLIYGHYPDSGPGPQKLLRGDWNLGYFGFVPIAQFFSASSYLSALNLSASLGTTQADWVTGWHKFIHKGKIVYIPNNVVVTNTSWAQLYNAGLVFGMDNTGVAPYPITQNLNVPALVNQNKQVVFGAYTFRVRLPNYSNKALDQYVTSDADKVDSEWNQLMTRVGLTTTSPISPSDKWNDTAPPTILFASMNFTSGGTNLEFLANNWDASTGRVITTTLNNPLTTNYLPVLELIL
jgi:hypothetical protein